MEPLAAAVLKRYQVMALVVGVALAILTLLILIFGFGATAPKTFSPFHGVLYVAYLLTLPGLVKQFELSKGKIALLILSGIIPFLAFYVEKVTMAEPHEKRANSGSEG